MQYFVFIFGDCSRCNYCNFLNKIDCKDRRFSIATNFRNEWINKKTQEVLIQSRVKKISYNFNY